MIFLFGLASPIPVGKKLREPKVSPTDQQSHVGDEGQTSLRGRQVDKEVFQVECSG